MRIPLMLLVLVGACGGESDHARSGARSGLVPDTQTVANVLEMRHDAEAFARAPQWRLADAVEVTYDPGAQHDFDFPDHAYALLLEDGHLVVLRWIGAAKLMLFAPDGTPKRILATQGEGPGELVSARPPILFGDSIAVLDGATARVNWFTASQGYLGSVPIPPDPMMRRPRVESVLPGRRVLAINRILPGGHELPPEGGRLATLIAAMPLDQSRVDTLAALPGLMMKQIETNFGGRRATYPVVVRLSAFPAASAWGDGVALTSGGDGYVIERRGLDGTLLARLTMAMSRRPVTEAMRTAVIEQALAQLEVPGGEPLFDAEESRRLAREEPIADSLPYLSWLKTDGEGVLWVGDVQAPTDSLWRATGFRQDGSIVGRLTGTAAEFPSQFLRDRVLLQSTDDDGIVRFVVRRIVKPE